MAVFSRVHRPLMSRSDSNEAGDSVQGDTCPRRGILIFLPSWTLLGLCLLQFGMLALLALMNWGPMRAKAGAAKPETRMARPAALAESAFKGHPGPWGELEFTRINLEPPDEFVDGLAAPAKTTRWHFDAYTRFQLKALFEGADLTSAQRAELLNTAAWEEDENGITVTPSDRLVLGINPQARLQIYSVLAESPRNDYHRWPCVFRGGGLDDWFRNSGLSDATLALLRQLVYKRGTTLCFSDLPEVLGGISDPTERRRLQKTLTRKSAVLMKLRIRPDSDVKALAAYWAIGGRAKDVAPLIDSLTQVADSTTLDVVHLLPPFARKRLNTYPRPEASPVGPDCYWTAMNFFNDPADERYRDEAAWREELKSQYTLVNEPIFGDLVFVVTLDGDPIHAAVFVADDVVFTKNGANYHQPWILAKIEDVLSIYGRSHPIRVIFFRRNSPPD
jgi:hypothetical protein